MVDVSLSPLIRYAMPCIVNDKISHTRGVSISEIARVVEIAAQSCHHPVPCIVTFRIRI